LLAAAILPTCNAFAADAPQTTPGPITPAGQRLAALRDGFPSYKTAWATGTIEYFWHDANPP
jgi:hypothetical protein